jgi:hypothetical protein
MSRIKAIISRADWQQHVSTWRTSGMTQAAYCRHHQLNATTFNRDFPLVNNFQWKPLGQVFDFIMV